MACLLFCV